MNPRIGTFNVYLFGTSPFKQKLTRISIFVVIGFLYAYTSDYNLATGTGNLSMVLFLAANIYFPAKKIRFYYNIKNVQNIFRYSEKNNHPI